MADRRQRRSPRVNSLVVGGGATSFPGLFPLKLGKALGTRLGGAGGGSRLLRESKCMRTSENLKSRSCSEMPL